MTARRLLAALGPIGAIAGTLGGVAASVAAQRGPTDGLLSELGSTSSQGHVWYRVGQAAAAVGALAVATAIGRTHGAALVLTVAALLVGVASAVPCSTGCPIPLIEHAPVQDLIHFTSAGAAFALWPVATWAAASEGPLRRLSAATTLTLAALLILLGPLTLIDGHGVVIAVAQRLLVLIAMGWVAAVGAAVAMRR